MQKAREAIEDGTVGKALHLLTQVTDFDKPVRFHKILLQSPFPKASTYRLLQTLTNQQMLMFNQETQEYSVGRRLIRLAHHAWKHASLGPVAAPCIHALSVKTGQTVHLAQLDNGQVLYIDKRNPGNPVPMFSDTGKVGPAFCTGVGKAMLACLAPEKQSQVIAQQSFFRYTARTITCKEQLIKELRTIAKRGIAFDLGEHEAGIICMAAPILNHSGMVIGGLSITSATERCSIEQLSTFESELKATAQEIGTIASDWQIQGS